MNELAKVKNYMNRADAHGFTLYNKTKIMDVLIHVTDICDVKIYQQGKLANSFELHRNAVVEEAYKQFKNDNRSLCVLLFG